MSDIAWQDYHNLCDENERLRARITELERERDTATRALGEMRTALREAAM